MSLEMALRLTEMLLAFAFIIQSIEHINGTRSERWIFLPRLVLSVLLMLGFYSNWVLYALLLIALLQLHRFQGPYNGGSDRMGMLILTCLVLANVASEPYWQELAMGYLALQLVLSYFISGWVKLVNPEWRSGRALQDVFQFSAYPVSESLRTYQHSPRLLFMASWGVMSFELLLPLALFSSVSLIVALTITALFHFTNACIFGLNRFFWVWISAYPTLLWFQGRFFSVV